MKRVRSIITMKYQLIAIICFFVLFVSPKKVVAQDFLVSQPWSTNTTLGPSFAGLTGSRAFMAYRDQWSFMRGSQTLLAGFDHYYHPIQSSFGAVVAHSSYGGNLLTQTELAFQYNYVAKITDEWLFRPGIEFGPYYRAIDPSKFMFIDQIALDGTILPTSSFEPDETSVLRFDAAVSFLLYNEFFFIGAGADRLMSNDVSFANTNTKTDLKFNAYMAGRIPMNRGMGKYASYDDVTIAGLYQQQGLYQQMDLDVLYHRIPFELGIGYRGIPFVSPQGLSNTDALKLIFGYSFGDIVVSYSYDVSISSLFNVSGGSHELVLSYRFNQKTPNDVSFFCY